MTNEELQSQMELLEAVFIRRMRAIYGDCEAFREWVEAFEFVGRHPADANARELACQRFEAMARTKHPEFSYRKALAA